MITLLVMALFAVAALCWRRADADGWRGHLAAFVGSSAFVWAVMLAVTLLR